MDLRPSLSRIVLLAALAVGPAALSATPKHLLPVPAATQSLMRAASMRADAPILVRAFKKEAELEVWKRGADGRYALLKTFPICRWSGQLGPKRKQGDRQSPEGFYTVGRSQMNPSSQHYLAFNVGFPNAYDRSIKASGSALMVHGTCSSAGCYAMTNEGMAEVYALAREAFSGGQGAFQFHAFPFRMTAENMVRHRGDPNIAFWAMIKEGYDRFEATREEPRVSAAKGRYAFQPYLDIERETAAIGRVNAEAVTMARLLSEGKPAYQVSYADGGQNPVFSNARNLGDVSRPEALQQAGVEIKIAGSEVASAFRMPTPRPVVAALPAAAPAAAADVVALAMALGGGAPRAIAAPEPLAIAVSLLDPGSIVGGGAPVTETFRPDGGDALFQPYVAFPQPTIVPATQPAPLLVATPAAEPKAEPVASTRRF